MNAMSCGQPRARAAAPARSARACPCASTHAEVQVRRLGAVVEEEQLAGGLVDLGVGRHALGREPAVPPGRAERVEGVGVEPVELAALPERREDLAVVDDHVGAADASFIAAAGAQAVGALGELRALGQPGPQRRRRPPARPAARRCARTGCGSDAVPSRKRMACTMPSPSNGW